MAERATNRPRARDAGFLEKVKRVRDGNVERIRMVTSFVVVAIIWEVVARYVLKSDLFLAPLSGIAVSFWHLTLSGELAKHVAASMTEFGYGFALALVIGVPLGVLMATSRVIRHYLDPLVSALYTTPLIALAPLFIMWFGLGIGSKIALIFLMSLFPILVNTLAGVRSTDNNLIEAAHAFGATETQIFYKVLIPSALPFIVSGLRLGVGRGLMGIVVGEMFGARAGVGFLIFSSSQAFDTAALFVGVLFLSICGFASVQLLLWVEKRLAPWREFKYD